jgi:hypothetical protein
MMTSVSEDMNGSFPGVRLADTGWHSIKRIALKPAERKPRGIELRPGGRVQERTLLILPYGLSWNEVYHDQIHDGDMRPP